MKIQGFTLDEIIKAQKDICKLQMNIHIKPEKYSPNMRMYFEQLEDDPKFYYIINNTPMQLFYDYEKNLEHIVGMIYNENFSKKQNVLNVLEYMRIMTMYENVKQKTSADKEIMDLSRYPLFLSVFGKGFCYSQAKFARDILLHMGLRAGDFDIDIYKYNSKWLKTGIPHQDTSVEIDNEYYTIDPTEYDGTLDGMQFKVHPQNAKKIRALKVRTDFSATQEEIKESRNFVLSKLVKELGIDKISKELKLENKKDLQKQCTIMAFVESRLNLTKNLETHMSSANLNGINLEVGKLIELFFYQNNINYDIECRKNNRKNTMYNTKIGKSNVCLCPALLYSSDINKPGILIRGSHFVKKEDKMILIYSLNAEVYKTYINFINQGRLDVLHLAINDICKANNMDINTFLQAPMENMKKYAPEVNVDAFVMRTLTKNIETELPENRNSKLTAQSITQGVAKIGTKSGIENTLKETIQLSNGATLENPNEEYRR